MTPNKSMELTLLIQNLISTDLVRNLDNELPPGTIASFDLAEPVKKRDRVYNSENTFHTMLLTSFQEDKSLKNSVAIFSDVFNRRSVQLGAEEKEVLEQERLSDAAMSNKMGRPKKYKPKLAKSKTKEISQNTAAYSKARSRIGMPLLRAVFDCSRDFGEKNDGVRWHGFPVLIADGTYFQMQDSPGLRAKYQVREGDGAYPQGLLEVFVRQGSGYIANYEIGSRHQSELELCAGLVKQLKPGGLLIADDLYSCYAVFYLMQRQGCHLLVPGKRKRTYKVAEKIAEGDEIVQLSKNATPPWWKEDFAIPAKMLVRRITYNSPVDGETECVLYTTILDKSIPKTDFITKYETRWDIEISIREIKALMGLNVARSKTEEMVFKEFIVAMTAYNLIRKIISKSVENTGFPPQKNILQEYFDATEGLLMDKKGRVYSRWSQGRYAETFAKG